MKHVQKSIRGGLVSRTKLNELEDAINDHAALHGCDGIVVVDGNGIKLNLARLIEVLPLHPVVRRVVAQEDAPADGQLSVKLVDENDVPYGDAFDIENIQAANWEDVHPLVLIDDFILAVEIQGVWYGIAPGYTDIGKCEE